MAFLMPVQSYIDNIEPHWPVLLFLENFTLATLACCVNSYPLRSFAQHKDLLAAIPIINDCFGLKISGKSFTCDSPPGSAASSQEEPDIAGADISAADIATALSDDSANAALLDITNKEV